MVAGLSVVATMPSAHLPEKCRYAHGSMSLTRVQTRDQPRSGRTERASLYPQRIREREIGRFARRYSYSLAGTCALQLDACKISSPSTASISRRAPR